MTTELQLTADRTADGEPRLTAVGEIDLSNAEEFTRALAGAVGPAGRLVVDLTRVDYLDSAALAALFAQAGQIEIHIAALNESLFTVCGLAELTEVRVTPPATAG